MSAESEKPRERNALVESLYVGAGAGVIGGIIGTGVATFRGRHAGISAVAAGGNAFMLSTIFWYSRSSLIRLTRPGDMSPSQELAYSTFSGSIAGAAVGATVGRRNILPGALVMGCVGGAGELVVRRFKERRANTTQDIRPLLVRLSESNWWPLKSLSDDEYETMLRDKIKMADSEIAGLDEQIETLRAKTTSRTGASS